VPASDRYQIITQHDATEIVAEDTDLGIVRSSKLVIIQVVSRSRTKEEKLELYRLLARNLERDSGLAPSDLIVTITENADEDWSFGHGRAQFVTGELT
jgi:phenylpyruvate tautomerase PptA (4-oxalocrotonate tautomerase family)